MTKKLRLHLLTALSRGIACYAQKVRRKTQHVQASQACPGAPENSFFALVNMNHGHPNYIIL